MESSESAKDSATEELISEAKEEKGSESRELIGDATEVLVSDVKDVSIELVEPKKEEVDGSNLEGVQGETSVIKRDGELLKQGSEAEASGTQESVPTTSLPSHEDNPTVDTTTTTTTTTTTIEEVPEAPAPILENRASIWNCCGLLDMFKGSQR